MRVVVAAPFSPWHHGGLVAHLAATYADGLKRRGHTVELWTSGVGTTPEDRGQEWRHGVTWPPVNTHYFAPPRHGTRYMAMRSMDTGVKYRALAQFLQPEDVLLLVGAHAWHADDLARARLRCRVYYAPQGFHRLALGRRAWRRALDRRAQRGLLVRSTLLAASRGEVDAARRIAPLKSSAVLPVGIHNSAVHQAIRDVPDAREHHGLPDAYVLHLGGDLPHTRLASAAAAAQAAGVPLVMAGPNVERWASRSEGRYAVKVTTRRDVLALLRDAQALLDASTFEPHAMHLLEALATGTPFVAVARPDTLDLGESVPCPIVLTRTDTVQEAATGLLRGLDILRADPPAGDALQVSAANFEWDGLLDALDHLIRTGTAPSGPWQGKTQPTFVHVDPDAPPLHAATNHNAAGVA